MDTFSLKRILLLLKKQFLENEKTQLFIVIGTIAVLFFILLFQYIILNDKIYSKSFHIILFMYSSLIFGAINASFSFREFRKNSNRTHDLILPVSSIEKFISNFIYNGIIFLFVFLATFLIADILACSIHGIFSRTGIAKFDYVFYFQKALFSFKENSVIFTRFIILWFTINSLFTFGSVRFKEFPLVYTFIMYVAYGTFVAILNIFLLISWKDSFFITINKISGALPDILESLNLFYSNSIEIGTMTFAPIFIFTLLYTITVFLIKEKEA